jgi:galactose mutarotase-like enzyme
MTTATVKPATRLRSPLGDMQALFAPASGMLGISLRHRGAELLGARGIPLLHPWANRLTADLPDSPYIARDEHGLPIHGVTVPYWEVFASTSWAIGAQLDFGAHPELLELFPFPHRLLVRAFIGARTLTIRTTLIADGELAVPVSFGFHPYLRLPGAMRATWRVEMPAMDHLELDDRGIPTGASEPVAPESFVLGARTYDDGYRGLERHACFALSGGGRRIVVRLGDGYPCAQVYAPCDDDVICFEPMTAPTNALVTGDGLTWVRPGSSYTATFAIEVS